MEGQIVTDDIPKDRAGRIAHIAKIAIGRDPKDPSRPIPGWQAKLSAALGMSHGAVNATLRLPASPVFDRKLNAFAIETRHRLHRDIDDLESYFKTLNAEQEAAALEGDDE